MGRLGELLVILAIVFMLFGSRRLKDFGSDLGAAIKGFKANVGNTGVDAGNFAEPRIDVIAGNQNSAADAITGTQQAAAKNRL